MHSFGMGLGSVAIGILTIVGCGSLNDSAVEEIAAGETPVETLGPETSAPETPTAEVSDNQVPTGESWTTVATLRSSDPAWQGMNGLLVSSPFTTTDEVRVVLDMPNAERTDGIVGVIIPADKTTDARELLGALRDGLAVTMIAAAPVQVFSGLDGTYVLVQSVPVSKAWSLDVQTRP